MHLLYLDESGNPSDPADQHFVVAGLSAFEKNTHFLTVDVERIQARHFPQSPPVDFHAGPIRSGKGFWRRQKEETRDQVLVDLAEVLVNSYASVRLFGAVIEKDPRLHGDDAIKAATEQVCKRFDTMLKRRLHEDGDEQRGLIVFAESHYQQRARVWVNGFKDLGTQWGLLHSLCDIPYFAPAKESRLLQLADFVSHALFLLYERRDNSLAKTIMKKFDQTDGILHGLVHVSSRRGPGCDCPACFSRRSPRSYGPWVS